MADEVYDIFDKEGRVIGTATWSECHRKGLIHQVSSVLVFKDSSKKEILLQKRSDKMNQDPSLLQHSAGGHTISGKTPEEGAEEELREELFRDHELSKLKLTKVCTFFQNDLPNNNEIMNVFEFVYPGPFYFGKELAEEPVWVKWEDLIKDVEENSQKYTKSFRNILDNYGRIVCR
jgi:isopentenyldiphosphate isomerase